MHSALSNNDFAKGLLSDTELAEYEAIEDNDNIPRKEKQAQINAIFMRLSNQAQTAYDAYFAAKGIEKMAERYFEEQMLPTVSEAVQEAWKRLQGVVNFFKCENQAEWQKDMVKASLSPAEQSQLETIDEIGEVARKKAQYSGGPSDFLDGSEDDLVTNSATQQKPSDEDAAKPFIAPPAPPTRASRTTLMPQESQDDSQDDHDHFRVSDTLSPDSTSHMFPLLLLHFFLSFVLL